MAEFVGDRPLQRAVERVASKAAEQILEQIVLAEARRSEQIAEAVELTHAGNPSGEQRAFDPDHAGPLHAADAATERGRYDIDLGPGVGAERVVQRLLGLQGVVEDSL